MILSTSVDRDFLTAALIYAFMAAVANLIFKMLKRKLNVPRTLN